MGKEESIPLGSVTVREVDNPYSPPHASSYPADKKTGLLEVPGTPPSGAGTGNFRRSSLFVSSDELDDYEDGVERLWSRLWNSIVGRTFIFVLIGTVVLLVLLISVPMSPISVWTSRANMLNDSDWFSKSTNATSQPGYSSDTLTWQSALSDDLSLNQVWLPGTHDSIAHTGGAQYECQSLPLSEQLAAGVRSFDIRLALNQNNTLDGYHGKINQGISWPTIRRTISYFLGNHTSEYVVVKVQQEWTKATPAAFAAKFSNISDTVFWRAGCDPNGLPTVGDVRGKIVFMARGFSAPDGTCTYDDVVESQDEYNSDDSTKAARVLNFARGLGAGSVEEAPHNHRWRFNYLSLHNKVDPPALAAATLNLLVDSVTDTANAPQSVILDYPSVLAIKTIIKANFPQSPSSA
ncbi:hypothetical protein PYCC9005_002041 [Savitreella phatthalungensis]